MEPEVQGQVGVCAVAPEHGIAQKGHSRPRRAVAVLGTKDKWGALASARERWHRNGNDRLRRRDRADMLLLTLPCCQFAQQTQRRAPLVIRAIRESPQTRHSATP